VSAGSETADRKVTSDQLFLRWDLVEHVARNLPRTVCLFLPDKQVLAAEMDLLPVPRHLTFEHRGRNRDVTHHVEAVPIDRQRERHKVRVGDKLLVILADRGLAGSSSLGMRTAFSS
jgi:hypothetical protein